MKEHTYTSKHLTVRVNEDESITLSTDTAAIDLSEFAVYDLIDSLAAMGYEDYMILAAHGAQLENEKNEHRPFTEPVNSLAESN
jgi:hypothetical protein